MPRMTTSSPRSKQAGHPVVRIVMKSIDHIGQEFFRFEMATAVAGAVLGINPFNQPDVEAAKIKTRELTAAFEKTGALPAEQPVVATAEADLYTDEPMPPRCARPAPTARSAPGSRRISRVPAAATMSRCSPISSATRASSTRCRRCGSRCATSAHVATCAEFGPRFLHSTGQAYKGGPDSGVFLQITADDAKDLPVPGQKASFGVIKAAQARGDFDVLTERGRRALRVHLKGDLRPGACRARCRDYPKRSTKSEVRFGHAARHDRPRPDGRQHRPAADEERPHGRGLRQGSQGGRGAGGRRRGRRRLAGRFRRASWRSRAPPG